MMETVTKYANKRKRSEEDGAAVVLQRKMFINEKVLAAGNDNKMRDIQNKTLQLLFKAAHVKKDSSKVQETNGSILSEQIILTGNGEIQLRNFTNSAGLLPMERAKAKCCNRDTLLQMDCQNCTLPVCEYCGYSCAECGSFLCGTCVNLFDCGTAENPICQNCSFYK